MDQTAEPSAAAPLSTPVAFDGWTLDRKTGDLWKAGVRQRLQEQPLQILNELLARPGELVTREQLITHLWPKGVVDFDTGLNTAMRKLRLALGDDPNQPRYIETLPRKGYRFIGKIDLPKPVEPEGSTQPGVEPRRSPRRLLLLGAAAAFLAAGATLIAWNHGKRSASPAASPSPVAVDLYLTAKARQPEISPNEGAEPRQRVLDLLGRALAIDPSLAPAYVVRAWTNLDLFISNLDVSDELLAAVRKDLETARQLSRNDQIGLDVRIEYAAVVDLDPAGALRLAESAPDDPDVLQTKAGILMTLGRFRESDEIYDRFLALDPANQRMLRIKLSNLLVERRGREALEAMDVLKRVSPPGRIPGSGTYAVTGLVDFARPSLAQVKEALRAADPDGERLLHALPELNLMRMEHRYAEIRDLLDEAQAESMRVPMLTGGLPGVGRMPVAVLRGWNQMLSGDATGAAASGRKILEFVAAQRVTPWNKWHLRILEAEAQLFMHDSANAVSTIRAAFQESPAPLTNRHMEIFRQYFAAITLAWAGEHEESVALVEKLANDIPSIGPAIIARDPLISLPLQGNARFERLRKTLETQIEANAAR